MAASEAQPSSEDAQQAQCQPTSTPPFERPPQQQDSENATEDNQTPSESNNCSDEQAISVPRRTRYQLPFPTFLEQVFAPLDDALIALGQRQTAGFVHFFSMALTFFTSIEFTLIAPPTLYALGYDAAGGLTASVLIVLGIVSQIPKKFIFRPRPWMVGRALPIRRDKTSSFPSRAVVCAVVFSWLAGWSLELESLLPEPLSSIKLWLGIILMASLAAFARVNVGAHYPSDTILGFMLGCFVVKFGFFLERQWRAAGCGVPEVYNTSPTSIIESWSQLRMLDSDSMGMLAKLTVLAYAVTLVSIQGFWVKCSYVYGLLMSAATFRAGFLCNVGGSGSTASFHNLNRVTEHGSLREHVNAAAFFASLLIFGMLTRGKKGAFRIVSFTIIYFGTLLGLLYWRLRPVE